MVDYKKSIQSMPAASTCNDYLDYAASAKLIVAFEAC